LKKGTDIYISAGDRSKKDLRELEMDATESLLAANEIDLDELAIA